MDEKLVKSVETLIAQNKELLEYVSEMYNYIGSKTVTMTEAAQEVGVAFNTFKGYAKMGKIPGVMVGNTMRYMIADVIKLKSKLKSAEMSGKQRKHISHL